MIDIRQTDTYAQWFDALRDAQAAKRIVVRVLVILLCGGDKTTQDADIKAAEALAKGV